MDTFRLKIHTTEDDWLNDVPPLNAPIGGHDFTIFCGDVAIAIEPEPTNEITWGDIRGVVDLLNRLTPGKHIGT